MTTQDKDAERVDINGTLRKRGSGGGAHWFGNRDLPVLLYRVNRRPLAGDQGDFFSQPEDPFEHLREVLLPSSSTKTGRAKKHTWRVGNLETLAFAQGQRPVLEGRIGWSQAEEETGAEFDEAAGAWIDSTAAHRTTVVAPFAYQSGARILGVLKHRSFSETIVAQVFSDLLNAGERQRNLPSTEWGVEPIADEAALLEWIHSVDVLTEIDFVFRQPNPDADASYDAINQKLDALQAREVREEYKARTGQGLDKQQVIDDEDSTQFRAAAADGFGYVTARGQTAGKPSTYDQRQQVAREPAADIPDDWRGAAGAVRDAVRRAANKFRRGG